MQVNVHEAKTNLSKLLEAVEDGETVVICRHGKPVAELVPAKIRKPRPLGTEAHLGPLLPDDSWWRPMTDEEAEAFLEGR
ncbi:MAG: type II toxin-antitoxin system Phd/YefM family antitoxin [Acidobacteriota bacterium]